MNKTLITFFTVLFCLTSSVGWSETWDELIKRDGIYYKKFSDEPFTGNVTDDIKGSFKNGKKDGSWFYYSSNGQLSSKGNFINGKKEGLWIGYWDNGQINYKTEYKNDVLEGSHLEYQNNGQLYSKGKRKNGEKHGYWFFYKKDGSLNQSRTGTYKNNNKIIDKL